MIGRAMWSSWYDGTCWKRCITPNTTTKEVKRTPTSPPIRENHIHVYGILARFCTRIICHYIWEAIRHRRKLKQLHATETCQGTCIRESISSWCTRYQVGEHVYGIDTIFFSSVLAHIKMFDIYPCIYLACLKFDIILVMLVQQFFL